MRCLYLIVFLILSFSIMAQQISETGEEDTLFYILSLNNRFELKRNFLNSEKPDRLTFSDDSTGYYFYTGGTIIWFINDNLEFNLSLNSGIVKISGLYYENGKTGTTINYEHSSDYALNSFFTDEIYIEYDGIFKFLAGKANVSSATDFVFNDYVFALRSDFYLYKKQKKELTFGLQYNTIDGYFNTDYKSSPMFTADISYKNSRIFRFSLFTSLFYDNDNAFGKIYEPFVEEFLVKKMSESGIDSQVVCGGEMSECLRVDSSGYLLWSGAEIKGRTGGFRYNLDIIINYGDMEVYPYLIVNNQRIDIYKKKQKMGKISQSLKYGDNSTGGGSSGTSGTQSEILNQTLSGRRLFGYMAFAEIGYRFFRLLEVSPYFLFMSGENDLEKSGFLNSFISIKSYITQSNIFFYGGLN
ncbi:MAG: hypothetical protein N3B13_00615, partial [Deltaproteobacteria bacterium]|nr:hypothetical protein [Deltaproteobacteria bacterium]